MKLHTIQSLVAVSATLAVIDAATCSSAQTNYIYDVYKQLASWSGCSKYVTYSGSTPKINWSCSSTDCIPGLIELANTIPSCEYAEDGVNYRSNLEKALYTQCRVCTVDQQKTTQTLWQRAAATSECAPYASTIGSYTSFSWPCSATGCTKVLKQLINDVPDCYTDGVNEKSRLAEPVSTCSSVDASPTPSKTSSGSDPSTPATPSPGGGSSGTCTDAQATQSEALWKAAAATSACEAYSVVTAYYVQISWPCSATDCTAVMEQLADDLPNCVYDGETESEKESISDSVKICNGGDDDIGGDASPSPTSTSEYSSASCSSTEVADTVDLYLDVAKSDECAVYSIITTYSITITAPCTSPCVRQGFQKLATQLEDCYYSYDYENKKEQVNKELDKCPALSSGRLLGDMASSDEITISYYSKDPIGSPASTTQPPLASGGLSIVAASSAALALATTSLGMLML